MRAKNCVGPAQLLLGIKNWHARCPETSFFHSDLFTDAIRLGSTTPITEQTSLFAPSFFCRWKVSSKIRKIATTKKEGPRQAHLASHDWTEHVVVHMLEQNKTVLLSPIDKKANFPRFLNKARKKDTCGICKQQKLFFARSASLRD